MKIWIVIAYDPVPGVDSDVRILRYGRLAEVLLQLGHEVVFWTSTFNHAKKTNRYPADHEVAVRSRYTVQFMYGGSYLKNNSVRRILHNRSIASSFRRNSRKKSRPDIVFAGIPCVELTQATVAYGLQYHVPVVVDVQDLWPDIYLSVFPQPFQPIARYLLRNEFARMVWICQQATAITAVSQTFLRWGLRNAGRIARTSDGVFEVGSVDPLQNGKSRFNELRAQTAGKYNLSPDKTPVVFLGQFGGSYDLETVLDAADIVRCQGNHDLNFIFIGGGDQEKALCRRAQNSKNVQFLGWLNGEEATGVLANCAVGLAAYRRTATQSLPYKPFEYMAVGLPIVSSLRGELRLLIEGERLGFQYRAGDPYSLCDAIRELTVDQSYMTQAGSRARALFKRQFDAALIYPKLAAHLLSISAPELDN